MKTKNLHQPLEYTYSQSFRKIYQQNPIQRDFIQHSQRQQANRIFIEYQKAAKKQRQSKKNLFQQQKAINVKISPAKNIFQNPIKRLHTSAKKYSFSVFVKKSKKTQKERKFKVNSVQANVTISNDVKKVKGSRQLNSVIRTMYDNFRKFQNTSRKSQVSKSSRNSSQSEIKKYQSPQFRPTARFDTKIMIANQSERQKTQESDNQTCRTKLSFLKTMNFGQKLHHSKQLQNFRSHQSSRGFLCIGKKQPPHIGYTQDQSGPDSFLKIQRCSLQKKDQQFLKNGADFRQIVLKDRLEKQNKKKASQLMKSNAFKQLNEFSKYVQTSRENKYVSEMRQVKKKKKKWFKDRDDDNSKNKISPW